MRKSENESGESGSDSDSDVEIVRERDEPESSSVGDEEGDERDERDDENESKEQKKQVNEKKNKLLGSEKPAPEQEEHVDVAPDVVPVVGGAVVPAVAAVDPEAVVQAA